MKIGIILQSNKPERVWNTFRFAITSLKAGHQVETFLMNEGSELDTIPDSEHFDISKKVTERYWLGEPVWKFVARKMSPRALFPR